MATIWTNGWGKQKEKPFIEDHTESKNGIFLGPCQAPGLKSVPFKIKGT